MLSVRELADPRLGFVDALREGAGNLDPLECNMLSRTADRKNDNCLGVVLGPRRSHAIATKKRQDQTPCSF